MLTTAPLRGAYLHQLLQLCQAMHPQTPFTPSPTPQGLRPQAQHDPSYQLQQQLLQRMQQHSQQPSRQHVQQFGQQVQQSSQLHQQLQAQQLAQQLTQQLSQQQLSQQQLERQQGQFHQQLQRQLQQRLLAMSNADSGAGSSFQASQVPQLANQTLLVNAQVQQQMSERLQANAAEHLRTAVSQGTYDNTDTQSTVSAGHLSPLSPRCSQESQTVLPTSIAPSGTPQHSASSSAQRGLSHAVLEAQARAQQAQQGLVGGAVLSNSPVTIPPSFWAGAHGQKAMAEGQGSIPQSPSLQGLTLQGLSQQSMPSAGLSQHAVHQNALHQHGLAAHALQGQHSSSSHGSPLEGRAVGSPALARGQSQGVSQVQGGSPDAAALQSLLLQLQATGESGVCKLSMQICRMPVTA